MGEGGRSNARHGCADVRDEEVGEDRSHWACDHQNIAANALRFISLLLVRNKGQEPERDQQHNHQQKKIHHLLEPSLPLGTSKIRPVDVAWLGCGADASSVAHSARAGKLPFAALLGLTPEQACNVRLDEQGSVEHLDQLQPPFFKPEAGTRWASAWPCSRAAALLARGVGKTGGCSWKEAARENGQLHA